MLFSEINPKDFTDNAIKLIGLDWMLIAAGDVKNYNMMTASWGGLGMLWHKPVCFIFVRPSRYTFDFLEEKELFSLNFFTDNYRSILNFCGSNSGRDVNKMKAVTLTPVEKNDFVFFDESRLVLLCNTLYFHDINPDHLLPLLTAKVYKNGDFHRLYIGEILTCLQK